MRKPVCIFEIDNENVYYTNEGGDELEIVTLENGGSQVLIMDIHGTDITLAFVKQPDGGHKVIVTDETYSDKVGGHPFEEYIEELFDADFSNQGCDTSRTE